MVIRTLLEPSRLRWFRRLVVLWLVMVVIKATGYSTGAPKSACEDMIPHHGTASPQNGTDGLGVSITASVISTNDKKTNIEVKVRGTFINQTFTGFMLQARHFGGNTAIGSFTRHPSNQKGIDCFNTRDSALTNANPKPKLEIGAVWTNKYNSDLSDLIFIATIVRTEFVFWVNVTSDVLYPTVTTTPSGRSGPEGNQTTTGAVPTTDRARTELQTTVSMETTSSRGIESTTDYSTVRGETTVLSFTTTEQSIVRTESHSTTQGSPASSDHTTEIANSTKTSYISSTEMPATTMDSTIAPTITKQLDATTSVTATTTVGAATESTTLQTFTDSPKENTTGIYTTVTPISTNISSTTVLPNVTSYSTVQDSTTVALTNSTFSPGNDTTTVDPSTSPMVTFLNTTPQLTTVNITTAVGIFTTQEPVVTTSEATSVITAPTTLQTTQSTSVVATTMQSLNVTEPGTSSSVPETQTNIPITTESTITNYTRTEITDILTTRETTSPAVTYAIVTTTPIMSTTTPINDVETTAPSTLLSTASSTMSPVTSSSMTTEPQSTAILTTTTEPKVTTLLSSTSRIETKPIDDATTAIPSTNVPSTVPSTLSATTSPVTSRPMTTITTEPHSTTVLITTIEPVVTTLSSTESRIATTPSVTSESPVTTDESGSNESTETNEPSEGTFPSETTVMTESATSEAPSETTLSVTTSSDDLLTTVVNVSSKITPSVSHVETTRVTTTQQPIIEEEDNEVYLRFEITNEEFTDNLTDPSSARYKDLQSDVIDVLNDVYSDTTDFQDIRVVKFLRGSVIPEVQINFSSNLDNDTKLGVVEVLFNEVQKGALGEFEVDNVMALNENGVFEMVDVCFLLPCPSGAFCFVNKTDGRCWSNCSTNPGYCKNGATCVDHTGSDPIATCSCTDNYDGLRCDIGQTPTESNNSLIIILSVVCAAIAILFITLSFVVSFWCRRVHKPPDTSVIEESLELADFKPLWIRSGPRRDEFRGREGLPIAQTTAGTSYMPTGEAMIPHNFVAIDEIDTSSGSNLHITDSESDSENIGPQIIDGGASFPFFQRMTGSIQDLPSAADYELDAMQQRVSGERSLTDSMRCRSVSFSGTQQVISGDDRIGFENFSFGNAAVDQKNNDFEVIWDFRVGGSGGSASTEEDDAGRGAGNGGEEGGGSGETAT